MRKNPFTDEQMIAIVRESDKTSVAAAAKCNKLELANDLRVVQALLRIKAHRYEAHPGACH